MIKNKEKIIRGSIMATIFIAMIIVQGMAERQANQVVFMLAMISIFSLYLRNLWATLFVIWTVFLYAFFKFSCGNVYLTNILFGAMLYLFTKNCFKKEHINLYLTTFLWFVFVNIAYGVVQLIGFDFIFHTYRWDGVMSVRSINAFTGFMGAQSILGMLLALSVPILASRGSKSGWVCAIMMLFPLYICTTALCLIAGIVGLLFILFFRARKTIFFIVLAILMMFGLFYVKKVDNLGTERFPQWHKSLSDYMIHPITGWGLDSFANVAPHKDFKYSQTVAKTEKYKKDGVVYENITSIVWWDNPHNLIITILYEFGFIGFVIVFMYHRSMLFKFLRSSKTNNTIALAGFAALFVLLSMGHFPIHLARLSPIIICGYALLEVNLG